MVESNPEVKTQEVEAPEQENPATYEKIVELLKAKNIEFKVTEHAPVKTSQEAADIRGVALESGAKAMLIKDEGKKLARPDTLWYLAIMAANRRLSSKMFKKLIGSKNIKFADAENVHSITGCISGAVPPFGSVFNEKVPTMVDESLEKNESINFNCGLRTHSM